MQFPVTREAPKLCLEKVSSFQVVHSNPLKDGCSPSLTWKGSGFSGILDEFPGVFRWQGAVLPFSFSVLFLSEGSTRRGSTP